MSDAAKKGNSAIELIKSRRDSAGDCNGDGSGLGTGPHRPSAQQAIRESPTRDRRKIMPTAPIELEIPFRRSPGEIHSAAATARRAGELEAKAGEGSRPGDSGSTSRAAIYRWRTQVSLRRRQCGQRCPSPSNCDQASVEATIADTGGRKTFKPLRAGMVNISSAGWRGLQIVPVKIAHDFVMILRGVRLVPVRTSS